MRRDIFNTENEAPEIDHVNKAGGVAYVFNDEHALAQYSMTGCFGDTYYAKAEIQLEEFLGFCERVDDRFLAQCAVHSRKSGYMKDAPAVLFAVLATRNVEMARAIFPLVVDNVKMLRNVVQVMRSGVTGRKTIPRPVRRMIKNWMADKGATYLFKNSVGQKPSLADIVKMLHPDPKTEEQDAFYEYLIGKIREDKYENLPELVRHYESFKRGETIDIPDVPFQMIASVDMSQRTWKEIFRNGNWHFTRMNLNTAKRHGVLEDKMMVDIIANRIKDEGLIRKSRVFPYQLMSAYFNADGMPRKIVDALHDALEISVDNVPKINGQVAVFPDVSGSMSSPVTGYRYGATTTMTCHHISALVAAVMLRMNPESIVIPFEEDCVSVSLEPRDTIMTNAKKISEIGGGGTKCSAPMYELDRRGIYPDFIIFVSDNMSWINGTYQYGSGTETMQIFQKMQRRNKNLKMVCIDIQPTRSTQVKDVRGSILNVGGFSDTVFSVMADFAAGIRDMWVERIRRVEIGC